MKTSLLGLAVISILTATHHAQAAETIGTQPSQVQPPPSTATTATPAATDPATTVTTTTTTTAEVKPAAIPDNLDCSYAISPQTTQIDPNLIIKWAGKAAEQSFTFDYAQIDMQMEQLKKCFTSKGWEGFQEAFNKSGNLNAIKTQQLNVSAMAEGTPVITDTKENEWKLTMPMQVVYQNKEQKLHQQLTVDILIGRKLTGDLGIMQIVAVPKAPTPPSTTSVTTPAPTPDNTPAPTTKP